MSNYNSNDYIILGAKLRELRESKDYSLQYVADKLNKSKSTVQRYEIGFRRIDIETMKEMCKIYDYDFKKLMSEVTNSINDVISDEERELINIYRKISEQDRSALLTLARSLSNDR